MSRQQQKDKQYSPLTGQYVDSADETDSVLTEIPARRSRKSRWHSSCCCLSFSFILTAAISALVGAILAFHSVNMDRECAEHTAKYSPLLNDVDIKFGVRTFNGSFKAETIYRKAASPEVDAAWEELGLDSRAGVISVTEGHDAGLSQHHVQVSEQYGGGYFVNVEGMHHLHCLNLLRKGLWYNYDYYRALGHHAFKNEEKILQLHITHCLDTIRQVLMCNVDTGVLGQVWYKPGEDVTAFPDFQTQHMCKNFEDVRDWAVKLQAPPQEELPADFMKAPEVEDVLTSDI